METQKIVDFLNNLGNKDSKFATTKWSVIDNEKRVIIHTNFQQVH